MFYHQLLPVVVILSFICFASIVAKMNVLPGSAVSFRYGYIDGVRGLAAAAVIITHFWRISAQGLNFDFEINLYPYYRDSFGAVAVQLFFCVTGFLFFGQIYRREGRFDWGDFYTARVRRLVPAYMVFYVAAVVAIVLAGNGTGIDSKQVFELIKVAGFGFGGIGRKVFVQGVQLDHYFVAIWTLAYEIRFYLIFPFMVWVCSLRGGMNLGFLLVSLFVLLELYFTGTTYVGLFLTGALAARVDRGFNPQGLLRHAVFLLVPVCIGLALVLDSPIYGWVKYVLVSLSFIALVVSRPGFLAWKPLLVLGDISYSVYLFHALILMLISHALRFLFERNPISLEVFSLLVIASVFVIGIVSVLTYKYIEYPFLRRRTA